MNYQHKYYKYKNKFLKLRNQKGGTPKSFVLDHTTDEFVKSLELKHVPPIYTLPTNEARKLHDELARSPVQNQIPANIEDKIIENNISIRIIRPLNNKNKLPVVIYFHGGGWILGSEDIYDSLIKQIANGANTAVIFLNYSLAPEAKYPTQIDESYRTALYISQHASEMNVDADNMVIMGDSAGGNIAIAITLMAKERKIPKIKYQILVYPITNVDMKTESYKKYADGPWVTKKAMEWSWNAYLPNSIKGNEILASPLKASIDQLRGLPPALIITDDNDVLRDEGEEYAYNLIQADVDVVAVRYLGTQHGYLTLDSLKNTPAAKNTILLINSQLRKIFGN